MSYPSCLLVSCYIFLWAFVYSVTAGWWSFPPSDAVLKPDDPIFEEGDTLILNCTLTERYNGTRNASSLAFRLQQRYWPEYVSVLSDKTAQLRLPNATLQDYGTFFCYMLPNRSLGIAASQMVMVVRRPMKPVQECRVYNWQRLECSWTPSSKEQNEWTSSARSLSSEVLWHIQEVESNVCHSRSRENSFSLQRNVTSRNLSTGDDGLCVFQMGQSYCFQVELTNILMKPVRSDKVCFNTSNIVWPGPPEALNGSLSDDGKSILVQWKPPSSSFRYDPLQLTYSLAYKSQWDQSNTSRGELNAVSSVTLPGNPYTKYTVWLRVKTLGSGLWSNETKFEFQTPERAPYQQPVLNRRGFSTLSDDGVNREVAIYWKPVPREKFSGPGFHYVVSVKSCAIWETLNDQKMADSFLEIQLKPEATDVRIIAQNDVGNCTAPHEPIHIPSISSGLPTVSPVFEVIVEIDTKNLLYALIQWTYVSEPANLTGITIFWCSSSLHFSDYAYCEESVGWEELTLLQQQYNLSRDNSLYPIPKMETLRVGVSVDVNGVPCGIKWSKSLYALDEVAPPPEDVQVVVPGGSDHGYLYMKWKKPKCFTSRPCGYADEFLLIYCLVSTVDNEACVGKTPGAIVGIAIGSIIVLTVIAFGLYGTYSYCNKHRKQILTRGAEIVMSKTASVRKMNASRETQILYDNMEQ